MKSVYIFLQIQFFVHRKYLVKIKNIWLVYIQRMVLSNGAKKARHVSSIVNQNQGGGNKKAGFPYQVGRSSWTSVHFNMTNPVTGSCCKLKSLQMNLFPNAKPSRPVGASVAANSYFHIPGTK
jgi:hypothetical protein